MCTNKLRLLRFVDDADIIHVATDTETNGREVAKQMQQAMDTWEGGLHATGGALVPSKSHWYLIDHWWNGNKWLYMTKEQMPADIEVKEITGLEKSN